MLRQFFAAARSRRLALDALVRQVAEASVENTLRLVGDRVAGMSPCEARGYIRARARREVRRQAKTALLTRSATERQWESILVSRAAECMPSLTLRRLAAASIHANATQRRAA
jgi:hypothetical protein